MNALVLHTSELQLLDRTFGDYLFTCITTCLHYLLAQCAEKSLSTFNQPHFMQIVLQMFDKNLKRLVTSNLVTMVVKVRKPVRSFILAFVILSEVPQAI